MAGFNREKYEDSYYHYRYVMNKSVVVAAWRTFAYEALKWPDGIRPGRWERMTADLERQWNAAFDVMEERERPG